MITIDSYYLKKENLSSVKNSKINIKVLGKINLLLLVFVIFIVIISGTWKSDATQIENWAISFYDTCILTYGVLLQVLSLLLQFTVCNFENSTNLF